MSDKPIGYSVSLMVEEPVASSKNSRRIWGRGKRKKSLPSEKAVLSEKRLRRAAREAIDYGEMPFDDDDYLELDYYHDVDEDHTYVSVTKCGEVRKGKTGMRRDVLGMQETIADALQGVLYPNDSRIDCGSYRRVRASDATEG